MTWKYVVQNDACFYLKKIFCSSFTWNYFQGGLRFNNYNCSPGVRTFKTQEVVWHLSQIQFSPLKIWAWKHCHLECQFLCDTISSMGYLQQMLHFWDPCMQSAHNSHRGNIISLTELLQITYTLLHRYSCIFWFNIARPKFYVKELGKLHVSLQGWWDGLIYSPDGTLRNASTSTW